MTAPIQLVKHIVHIPSAVTASGARTKSTIINVVANTANPVNTVDVKEGSKISSVYIEMWVDGVTASKTVLGMVVKLPAGSVSPSYAETLNLMAYPNKRNVLEIHQGLAPSGGNIVPLFRGWIKIPKGKQRFALGDKLELVISATATNVNHCGIYIYKEYS